MTTIALLNTSIITADGVFVRETISLDEARRLVSQMRPVSFVGHPATAQIMTTLLGVDVAVSRDRCVQRPGDTALVFQLDGRPEAGRELSAEEIEEIGYSWAVLRRVDTERRDCLITLLGGDDGTVVRMQLTAAEVELVRRLADATEQAATKYGTYMEIQAVEQADREVDEFAQALS